MLSSTCCSLFNYLCQWKEVNIGGDDEIGLSVRVSIGVSVCVHDDWAGNVAPSCENFYIGRDMQSHECLLVSVQFKTVVFFFNLCPVSD